MKKLMLTVWALFLSLSFLQAQQEKEAKQLKDDIHLSLQEGAQPDIYVDGKKFDFPMELLDKDKIAFINVIKGEKALQEYNAPNGVVLITTKKPDDKLAELGFKKVKEEFDKFPKVIINGEESDRDSLEKLIPEDIERIDILKGEAAMQKYNAAHGAIIVTTKKRKKK